MKISVQELEKEKEKMKSSGFIFEKIDKNETRTYSTTKCARCDGRGKIDYFYHVDGGICFKCGGSGIGKKREIKIYTTEYYQKLESRRLERQKAKAPEENKSFFQKMGFSEEGKSWVILGETYSIKEEIKVAGGKYSDVYGWHFSQKIEGWELLEIKADEVFDKDEAGKFWQDRKKDRQIKEKIREANNELTAKVSRSDFVGNLDEKIECVLKLQKICNFESQWGLTYIYNFLDDNENVFIWKTSKSLPEIEEGDNITISGKIKEHNKYNGIKQTVLTRCKILGGKKNGEN